MPWNFSKREADRLPAPPEQFRFKGNNEWIEFSRCERKEKYSKTEGLRAAVEMQARSGDEFNVYECEFCGSWHIGHAVRWQDRVGGRPPGSRDK